MQNTSREFEIKLLFPNGKLKAIENFIISKGGLRRQHLQAAYIDTPDFLLTKSGVAFRIRKEGRQWVQTLKISTLNPLDRIEHNVILNSQTASLPQWSIASHQEDRAGQLLFKILPNLSIESLAIQYRTDPPGNCRTPSCASAILRQGGTYGSPRAFLRFGDHSRENLY